MTKRGVTVDIGRCHRLGKFLKALRFPAATKIDSPGNLPPSELRMLYFAVVAICHQTSPAGRPPLEGMVKGEFLSGWDYLRERWLATAKADPWILTPGWLMFVQPSDIVYMLYDNNRHCPAHITDPEGRARLLRDIGFRMYCDRVEHVDEYYAQSGGWLKRSDERDGLETILSRFEAYGKDPVKKKLTYFLTLMNRYGFWEYRDIHHLGAPIDYHETRLHLRLGTVKILDETILEKIVAGQPLDTAEDIAVRKAVYDAIFKIAASSGRTPADLHNFFWNVARNCCRRDSTHCAECGSHGALPAHYAELLVDKQCIFNAHCASAALPLCEKPKEPLVDTDLY